MRHIALAAMAALVLSVQAHGSTDDVLKTAREEVDQLIADGVPEVPPFLVLATIAAEDPDHLDKPPIKSQLTRMVAKSTIKTTKRALEQRADVFARSALLGERLSPEEVARVYIGRVFYGKGCFGHEQALAGLFGSTPATASEMTLVTLAALPRRPLWYREEPDLLAARVAEILAAMEAWGMIGEDQPRALRNAPIPDITKARGCHE